MPMFYLRRLNDRAAIERATELFIYFSVAKLQAIIACYENGQREPHLSILIAYADFFECSIDYLVGRTDDIGNIVINKDRSNEQSAILRNDEVELLKKYNKLNTSKRLKAQGYLEGLSEN